MTAVSHDLPACPKARVTKGASRWRWHHICPWHSHVVRAGGYPTWTEAQVAAAQHMKHCPAA